MVHCPCSQRVLGQDDGADDGSVAALIDDDHMIKAKTVTAASSVGAAFLGVDKHRPVADFRGASFRRVTSPWLSPPTDFYPDDLGDEDEDEDPEPLTFAGAIRKSIALYASTASNHLSDRGDDTVASAPAGGTSLGVFMLLKKGIKQLRNLVELDSPTQEAKQSGVYIERVYDFYDPDSMTKPLRKRRMQDDVFHRREILEEVENDMTDTLSDAGSDAGSDCSGSGSDVGSGSQRISSLASDLTADRSSSRRKSRDLRASGQVRLGGVSFRASTAAIARASRGISRVQAQSFQSCSNYDIVTMWGVLAGKLMSSDVGAVLILKTAVTKKKLTELAKEKASRVPPSVRVRAKRVVAQAKHLALKVVKEQTDVSHEMWESEDLLQELFGISPFDTLLILCKAAVQTLRSQPTLAEVSAPCNIFGDIHGQLRDLLFQLQVYGMPDVDGKGPIFVFNGDFVDRGRHQVEVAGILIAMKVALPDRVILVRGNHEDEAMNEEYGFADACEEALGESSGRKLFNMFQQVFNLLPLGCVIGKQILIVHGGIGTGKWSINELRNVQRPLTSADLTKNRNGWLYNILWSDPIEDDCEVLGDCFGVHDSPRGTKATQFAWDVTKMFCAKNNLALVVRSHQSKAGERGFSILHNEHLMRVFSARDYEGNGNDCATLRVRRRDGMLIVTAQVLRSLTKSRGVNKNTRHTRLSSRPSGRSSGLRDSAIRGSEIQGAYIQGSEIQRIASDRSDKSDNG